MLSNTNGSVNIGLIGLGQWAKESYIPILKELSSVNVTAVSVKSQATQQFAKETFGDDITVFSDYKELLSNEDIEAVFISLPNALHAQAIEDAVHADKHIFFEPPVGLGREEIDHVLDVMRNSRKVIQVDLELRYLPVVEKVRELITSGAIGQLLMGKIRLWCDWGYGGGNWNQNVEEDGFFPWLGCWYLDVLDVIFASQPTRVSVEGGFAMNGNLLDHGWASIAYPNGFGQFEFSLVAVEGTDITLHINGTEGEIEADLQSGHCCLRQKHQSVQQFESPCSEPVYGFAGMRESIIDFFAAIQDNQSIYANVDVCSRVHQVMMACAEASPKNKSQHSSE